MLNEDNLENTKKNHKEINSAVIPLEPSAVGHIIESPSFLSLPLWLSVFLSASSSLFFFSFEKYDQFKNFFKTFLFYIGV